MTLSATVADNHIPPDPPGLLDPYRVGQTVRLSAIFTDTGAPTDPAIVKLATYEAGARAGYVFGASAIVRDGVGLYHFDYLATLAGDVEYRWSGA